MQLTWAHNQALLVLLTFDNKRSKTTLRVARANPATTSATMHCAWPHSDTTAAIRDAWTEHRATVQRSGGNLQFIGAHLAVADGDPHGELGRAGAARLLRDGGGGPGDPMPLRQRPPPRAARARGAGVEQRRGVRREREREVPAVRRRRREEEVERGGAREHLERGGGGGGGATASAAGVRGRGRETRGWRRAHEPYHFLRLRFAFRRVGF